MAPHSSTARREALRGRAAALVVAAALTGTVLLPASAAVSSAVFTSTAEVGNNTLTADTLAPPTDLTVTQPTPGQLALSWVATNDTYADGYRVYRSTSSTGPWELVATVTPVTATGWTDTTPPAGTSYYVLKSYRHNWTSVDSNTASGTI